MPGWSQSTSCARFLRRHSRWWRLRRPRDLDVDLRRPCRASPRLTKFFRRARDRLELHSLRFRLYRLSRWGSFERSQESTTGEITGSTQDGQREYIKDRSTAAQDRQLIRWRSLVFQPCNGQESAFRGAAVQGSPQRFFFA